jgi:hypothetical protein
MALTGSSRITVSPGSASASLRLHYKFFTVPAGPMWYKYHLISQCSLL